MSVPAVKSSRGKNKGWGINSFSSWYSRTAHETFMAHGTTTKPLSALFFNSEDFRLSHIFQDCHVPLNTQRYNPYMRVLKMQPRVEYTESGALLGVSFDRAVGSQGRWGVRVQTAFKEAQLERKDKGWRDTRQTQNVVSGQVRELTGSGGEKRPAAARVYRLDFLEALPQGVSGNVAVTFPEPGSGGGVSVFDNPIESDGTNIAASLAYSPEGHVPRGFHLVVRDLDSGEGSTEVGGQVSANLEPGTEGIAYEVADGADMSALSDGNSTSMTGAARAALQDKKATYWVSSTFASDLSMNDTSAAIKLGVVDALEQYNENTFEWLHDRGYKFESDKCVGLGDTQVDLYFAYNWSSHFSSEVFARVVAPTATGKDIATNPYHIHLGNRGHWECGVGGAIDWAVFDNVRLSLGGDVNVVAKHKEQRPAVFSGSLVKNIGPALTANTSWQYVNAHALLTWVHPRNADFATTVGYKLLYKSEEEVGFIVAQTESWLGKKYNTTSKTYVDANNLTVDNTLAAANTMAFAHTFTMSMRYHLSDFVSVNAGSSYVFAGKNMPQETTMQLGCVVQI